MTKCNFTGSPTDSPLDKVIDKYGFVLIAFLTLAVMSLLAGIYDINLYIFAGSIVLLVTAPLFAEGIKKAKRSRARACKELLRSESPTDWLKFSTLLFVFAMLSSLIYGFVEAEGLSGSGFALLVNSALIFTLLFFLSGLLYTVRIIWFTIDPASKANIRAGQIMKATSVALIVGLVGFAVLFLQLVNTVFFVTLLIITPRIPLTVPLVIYLVAYASSYYGLIELLHLFFFRFNEKVRLREWIGLFCFASPWIVSGIVQVLMRFGITVWL